MSYDFIIADVFSGKAFGGNQLAVITHADGLSDGQMQALAREFNFSETTFVLPPNDRRADFNVRIFTPRTELMFAGHPTVGTAAVLATTEALKLDGGSGTVVFEEGVGLVTVAVRAGEGGLWSRLTVETDVEMPGGEPEKAALASVLSVAPDAVVDLWYGGIANPFCFVHLKSKEAVDKAVLDRAAWAHHLQAAWGPQIFFFAGDLHGGDLYARMFGPAFGIEEDAATGSGSAILAGCLAMRRPEVDLDVALRINQGVQMGRPSFLEAAAEKRAGRVRSVSVGGSTVIIAHGHLTVPGI